MDGVILNRHYYKNITLEQAFVGGNFKIQLENGHMVKVKLKPGSYTGQIIRLKNLKDDIYKGKVSDTLITINVLDHPLYRINGLNLEAAIVVMPAEAKLGVYKKLLGPDGAELEIKIPKDSRSNQNIVIPGKGLRQNENMGDIIFQLRIEDLTALEDEIKQNLKIIGNTGILH